MFRKLTSKSNLDFSAPDAYTALAKWSITGFFTARMIKKHLFTDLPATETQASGNCFNVLATNADQDHFHTVWSLLCCLHCFAIESVKRIPIAVK